MALTMASSSSGISGGGLSLGHGPPIFMELFIFPDFCERTFQSFHALRGVLGGRTNACRNCMNDKITKPPAKLDRATCDLSQLSL